MSSDYRWMIDADAYQVMRRLPRGRRGILERSLDRLATNPFSEPAFIGFDADGEEVFHLIISDYVVAYHVDHATRRIYIYEIIEVE